MVDSSAAQPGFQRVRVEKVCAYCGAGLEIALLLDADAESYRYACPECGKQYQVMAAMQPGVRLVRPRCDGKHDHYQETMF